MNVIPGALIVAGSGVFYWLAVLWVQGEKIVIYNNVYGERWFEVVLFLVLASFYCAYGFLEVVKSEC